MESLSTVLADAKIDGRPVMDSKTLNIAVVDNKNPKDHMCKALKEFKKAASKMEEEDKLSVLFTLYQELTSDEMEEIKKRAGENITVHFLVEPKAFKGERLDFLSLDSRLAQWLMSGSVNSFDKFTLIVPKTMVGDLSWVKELAPEGSILRRAAIIFLDQMFRASLPLSYKELEELGNITHTLSLFAQQA